MKGRIRLVVATVIVCAGCSMPPRDDRPAEVKTAAEKLEPAHSIPGPSNQDRADYLAKVQLSKVVGRKGRGAFDKPMAFIEGEIKNTGDQSLDKVSASVYLLDSAKKAVHEDTCHPILVNSFTTENTPLKPNYARKWLCTVDDIPDEWNGTSVDVKITDVEFSQP